MTIRLGERGVTAVLLDIEGTTTPIAFVHEVLFPYARTHLAAFLVDPRHARDIDDIARRLSREHADDVRRGEAPPLWPSASTADVRPALAAYAEWLMDRDRKSPGLKQLQGLIWEEGYRAGLLRGLVFPDVAGALRRWHAAGLACAIYSSGSELAQRRLFESTADGDLTPLLSGFFDTGVGAKVEAASYVRIASRLDRSPAQILFVSDISAELDAAADAGLHVTLIRRPGNLPQEATGRDVVQSLDEIG